MLVCLSLCLNVAALLSLSCFERQVDGLLSLFLGGEQTGNAWAAVLFGDHSPTGKLPVAMPRK